MWPAGTDSWSQLSWYSLSLLMGLIQIIDKCSYNKAQIHWGGSLSRRGQDTIVVAWGLVEWVAGALGSCLCRLCTKVQLPWPLSWTSFVCHLLWVVSLIFCHHCQCEHADTTKICFCSAWHVTMGHPRDCQEVHPDCQHLQVVPSLWCWCVVQI